MEGLTELIEKLCNLEDLEAQVDAEVADTRQPAQGNHSRNVPRGRDREGPPRREVEPYQVRPHERNERKRDRLAGENPFVYR